MFYKGEEYIRKQNQALDTLWLFLLAVGPQIMIYMEECHAMELLREHW